MDAPPFNKLSELLTPNTLIVGIGNALKGDDGAGPILCQKLKQKLPEKVIDAGTVPENYIQPIINKDPDTLLLVDAVNFNAAHGSVGIFSPEQIRSMAVSTHSLSPKLFLDVIAASISPKVYLLAIQPAQTEMAQPLSPEVHKTVNQLADIIIAAIT